MFIVIPIDTAGKPAIYGDIFTSGASNMRAAAKEVAENLPSPYPHPALMVVGMTTEGMVARIFKLSERTVVTVA